MIDTVTYTVGASLPDIVLSWTDVNGALIDFSDWSFRLRIGQPARPAAVEKVDGIDGSSTAPNVTVAWTSAEIGALDPAPESNRTYAAQLFATHIATGKERAMTFRIRVNASIAAPEEVTP